MGQPGGKGKNYCMSIIDSLFFLSQRQVYKRHPKGRRGTFATEAPLKLSESCRLYRRMSLFRTLATFMPLTLRCSKRSIRIRDDINQLMNLREVSTQRVKAMAWPVTVMHG